jgi:hypothetical protein
VLLTASDGATFFPYDFIDQSLAGWDWLGRFCSTAIAPDDVVQQVTCDLSSRYIKACCSIARVRMARRSVISRCRSVAGAARGHHPVAVQAARHDRISGASVAQRVIEIGRVLPMQRNIGPRKQT